MNVKKFIDPFSSLVHEMAKKFDMTTIENKIEDISKLLVEAESLLDDALQRFVDFTGTSFEGRIYLLGRSDLKIKERNCLISQVLRPKRLAIARWERL